LEETRTTNLETNGINEEFVLLLKTGSGECITLKLHS